MFVYKVRHMLISVKLASFALYQCYSVSRMPRPHPLLGWLYSSDFSLKLYFSRRPLVSHHLKMYYCSFLEWSRKASLPKWADPKWWRELPHEDLQKEHRVQGLRLKLPSKSHETQLANAFGQESIYTESNNSKVFLSTEACFARSKSLEVIDSHLDS